METILTPWNAHRAAKIKTAFDSAKSPELTFNWRAERKAVNMFFDSYAHTATTEDGKIVASFSDNALGEWVVTAWKYDVNLEDMKDLAIRAFYSTSHTPEVRGQQYIRDYESQLLKDLEGIEQEYHEEYISKYRDWVRELFSKHSRILSAMITGPARFPTSRNQKANSAYDSAYEKFNEWRENFKKRTLKRMEAKRTPEERADREWIAIKQDIFRTASTILGIDLKKPEYRGYSRTCFVTNLASRMETLAKNGNVEMLRRASDYIKSLNAQFKQNGAKEIFTSRHKFWKFVEEAEAKQKAQEERATMKNVEIEFDGGLIIKNYQEDRLQIVHDEKPPFATITLLKMEGWHWSRFNGCWQRQLTNNACHSAARIIHGGENVLSNFETVTEFAKKIWNARQE